MSMEPNDEIVERQKLVDVEPDEDPTSSQNASAPKTSVPPTPVSPVVIKKIKSISSGETLTRSPASCSIEQTTDKGQTSARVTYINERRHHKDESRFDFKRPRKLLKVATNSSITSPTKYDNSFDDRPIKHHSFISEVPDVKQMERALLGLLDDFHSGKLKAFGSGCTMDQMTNIREQQESLAKLHFELAAAEEDSLENGNDMDAAKAQENMMTLVQRLEQLSVSIEQLQTSHTGL